MDTDLVGNARAQLRNADESLAKIAKGSGVSYRWLIDFKAGRVKNPTLRTVRGLHAYLTKLPDHQIQPS
jgi:hypothetical protein